MEGSYILTKDLAELAASYAYTIFQKAVADNLLKRPCEYIVIMDPAKPFGCGCTFEEAILTEIRWGDPAEKYKLLARQKAEVSWRTGLPSHAVQQRAPYLLTASNTRWTGSEVRDGLVVACSAVEYYYDQLFAETIIAACRAFSLREMEKIAASSSVFMADYKE